MRNAPRMSLARAEELAQDCRADLAYAVRIGDTASANTQRDRLISLQAIIDWHVRGDVAPAHVVTAAPTQE